MATVGFIILSYVDYYNIGQIDATKIGSDAVLQLRLPHPNAVIKDELIQSNIIIGNNEKPIVDIGKERIHIKFSSNIIIRESDIKICAYEIRDNNKCAPHLPKYEANGFYELKI